MFQFFCVMLSPLGKRAAQFWFIVAALFLIGAGKNNPAFAQSSSSPWPSGCKEGVLGTQGQPDFQLTLICLPQSGAWNGNLFVYAHGFVNPQEALSLPTQELGHVNVGGKSLIQHVLDLGYAFATTSYSKNGWAIEQASNNLNVLVDQFKKSAPSPVEHVMIVGGSEGGLVTVMQLEKYPEIYNGGLSLCGVVGGSPLQVQYIGNFRAVFDYFYPDVFNFGIVDIPSDAPLQWQSTYKPAIERAIQSNPTAVQSLFRVTHAAEDSENLQTSRILTSQVALGYSIFETNDLKKSAGGNPFDNTQVIYEGSDNDQMLNSRIERVSADPQALDYLNRFYSPTGDLQRPLVTLHNIQDPNAPYQHEIEYSSRVFEKHRSNNLISVPIPGYGHCAFSPAEILSALSVLLVRTQSLPG